MLLYLRNLTISILTLLYRPTGDFLVDYVPHLSGLFLATGDSGHAFKVFPIIGDKIADAIEGKLDPELQDL
jgi:sarcosine oxidase/L-pipecolate oxidase